MLAWQAGLAWAFIIGVIVLLGAFVGPTIRKYTPRAAMLGTLAGISIAFISMRPAFQSWEVPWIAFISLGIVLISWTANVRLPWRTCPAGWPRSSSAPSSPGSRRMLGWSRHDAAGEVGRRSRSSACTCRFHRGDVFIGLAEHRAAAGHRDPARRSTTSPRA